MIHVLLTKELRLCKCRGFFLALISVLFFSCASNHHIVPVDSYTERDTNLYIPKDISWQPVEDCEWAQYFFYENKEYPVRYHCVKINLAVSSLKIITFPESENDFTQKDGKRTNYFTGLTAKRFSQKYNPTVSINTAPFGGKNKKWDSLAKITSTRTICGIHLVNGTELSPPSSSYSALCFKKSGTGYSAAIIKNQTHEAFTEYDFAFGGFFTILSDGEIESFAWRSCDSRTAAGISADGKTLFLLVVEGERWSKSHGLSYPECAEIMLALGAKNAMQMDGGGSSSLFINRKNMLSYPALRKNAVFVGFSVPEF